MKHASLYKIPLAYQKRDYDYTRISGLHRAHGGEAVLTLLHDATQKKSYSTALIKPSDKASCASMYQLKGAR